MLVRMSKVASRFIALICLQPYCHQIAAGSFGKWVLIDQTPEARSVVGLLQVSNLVHDNVGEHPARHLG